MGLGEFWTTDPRVRRRAEREELIAHARVYVEALAAELPDLVAAVGGSVARGDFNRWSDVDVVVVSDALPADARERRERLAVVSVPRVEPHAYTRAELARAIERGDPLARETLGRGVPLRGALPGAATAHPRGPSGRAAR